MFGAPAHIRCQKGFKRLVDPMYTSEAYTLEAGNESVISEYTTLYNAVDSLDNPDHIRLTKDYFQSSFSSPNVDLARDVVLARKSDGNLIASGIILPQTNTSSTSRLMIQVHPEYRRQGVGTRVLQHLTEVGLARGSSRFVCRFPSFRPYVIPFARNHDFNHEYTCIKMRIEHKKPVTTPSLPWGLTVRGLNIKRELSVWAELQNTIFKDNLDYQPVDVDTLKHRTKQSSFDRNLLILCTVNGRSVGYCMAFSVLSEAGEKTLKIHGMGVLPEYRRYRYGQALLFEILNRAYIKGHTSSELLVLSTNQVAINLYEKCGFRERYRYLLYKRVVEQ